MKLLKALTIAAAGVLAVAACGCSKGQTYADYMFAMNASARLEIGDTDEDAYNALRAQINSILVSADASLSATKTNSSIYAFNAAAPGERVEIDETAYEVLKVAKSVYVATGGAYNPAVYYSVDLFGFGARADNTLREYDRERNADGSYPLPQQKFVEAFKELATHFSELELIIDGGKYYAVKPAFTVTVEGGGTYSLALDLGGVGKGWCADRAYAAMKDGGFEYGYFDFASSSMAFLGYEGGNSGYYKLAPRDPRGERSADGSMPAFCHVDRIKDECLSTSGDYEQYYEIDGVRYCHIIDPATGAPIATGVASVTVLGGSAAENDALTTALSAMGKERAVQFINDSPMMKNKRVIMLIFEGDEGGIITNCPQHITVLNQKYKILNTVSEGRIVL